MKLRNKKTGEIVELCGINLINGRAFVRFDDEKGTFKVEARSLAELNAEWEDYEEHKEWYWFIEDNGVIQRSCHYEDLHPTLDKARKDIGNYFNTREEAEKAVEKLKAWKRLKDKGFKFVRIIERNEGHRVGQYLEFEMAYHFTPDAKQIGDDLDLLFGGEE